MWPGWRRDTKLSPACMRDVTCLEVRYQCSYPGGSGTVHGWRWDRNLWTWMEMSRYMDGDETRILGPGSWWGRTWMQVKHTSWDQNEFDMGLNWVDLHFSGPGWRRESTLKELMQESWDLDANETRPGYEETHILKSGWFWDWTWMELRCNSRDLDGAETSPGWRWVANIRTWIEVRQDMNKDETWI